jgi:CheY-like chemotaxis protein
MATERGEKTILVIDDEDEIRKFVARVLELEGYSVFAAADGRGGLRCAREHRPALVLLDLRLPDISGWAVLREIKANPELSTTLVVVFTASAEGQLKDKALSEGASGWLVKPLSSASLREEVARVLRAGA